MPDDLIDRFRQRRPPGPGAPAQPAPPAAKAWPTSSPASAPPRSNPASSPSPAAAASARARWSASSSKSSVRTGRRWRCWPATRKVRCRGGALLGDRFRMPSQPDDDGVFIRSLAAAGGRGAIADNLDAMVPPAGGVRLRRDPDRNRRRRAGDTAVHDLADVVVLLVQPETGDDIQWEKAGLLEVADVVVIHKADLPGAAAVEGQVRQTLALSGGKTAAGAARQLAQRRGDRGALAGAARAAAAPRGR